MKHLIIHKFYEKGIKYENYTKSKRNENYDHVLMIKSNHQLSNLTSHQDKLDPFIIPSSCLIKFNISSHRGLVKMSTN